MLHFQLSSKILLLIIGEFHTMYFDYFYILFQLYPDTSLPPPYFINFIYVCMYVCIVIYLSFLLPPSLPVKSNLCCQNTPVCEAITQHVVDLSVVIALKKTLTLPLPELALLISPQHRVGEIMLAFLLRAEILCGLSLLQI